MPNTEGLLWPPFSHSYSLELNIKTNYLPLLRYFLSTTWQRVPVPNDINSAFRITLQQFEITKLLAQLLPFDSRAAPNCDYNWYTPRRVSVLTPRDAASLWCRRSAVARHMWRRPSSLPTTQISPSTNFVTTFNVMIVLNVFCENVPQILAEKLYLRKFFAALFCFEYY